MSDQSLAQAKQLALLIFGLILSVYLITFSGKLHTLDEYSALANAGNLARTGSLNTDQMAWAWAKDYSQDVFGPDSHLYSKKSLGVILWAIPFYDLALWTNTGLAHGALLSSLVVAALGVVCLYLAAVYLSGSRRLATFFALLYGMGTVIWPYSKFLFNEGFAAASMAVAVAGLTIAARSQSHKHRWWLVFAGFGLGCALLARLPSGVIVPFALVTVYLSRRNKPEAGRWHALIRDAAALLTPVLFALLALATINFLRFGSIFSVGYGGGETFTINIWPGIRGLLLSPGKSIFIFSPPLILALFGIPYAWKHWRGIAVFCLGSAVATILVYSAWYGWDGGWCWGPRFLVPITPLLMLLSLPALQAAVRKRWLMPLVIIVAIMGVAVQVGGSVIDYVDYDAALVGHGIPVEAYYKLGYSQAVGHISMLNPAHPHWELLDLSWARYSDDRVVINWQGLVLILLSLGVSLAAVLLAARRRMRLAISIIGAVIPLLIAAFSLAAYKNDPWYADEVDMKPALAQISQKLHSGDTLVVELLPYMHFYRQAATFLNTYRGPAPSLVILRREPLPGETETRLLQTNLADSKRVWLLMGATPMGDAAATNERYLAEHAYLAAQRWLSQSSRVSLFYTDKKAKPVAEGNEVALENGIILSAYKVSLNTDGVILVDLSWLTQEKITADYSVFLQVLDSANKPVIQYDSQPVGGLLPSSKWQPGSPVKDRVAIDMPANKGTYTLIAGLYDPNSGQRLSVGNVDYILLAKLEKQ